MFTQKAVTRSAGTMMALIMLSRLFGLVRDMAISNWFGQGRNTDVYVAAFRLPDVLFYLIAGGVLSSAFVPVFVDHISNGRREEGWKLFSIVGTVLTIVIGVFVILGEVFTRQLVQVAAAPGFTGAELDQVAHLTRIILPAQLFFFMGGLMMASLWAHQQFVAPGLGPSIYNIGIIIGGSIAGARFGPQGIEGLAWGALAGAFLGNFVLQFIVLRRYGMTFRPSLDVRHPDAVRVWKLMLPVILSLSLPQVDVYFNGLFASYLPGGIVSALERANRLMQVPVGIFGQAIAIGFYTTLAAQYATNQMKEFRETINYGLRAIAFVSIPSTVALLVLGTPIVQVFLQQGKFPPSATHKVSTALVFYSIGIFSWSAQALIARSFYSMNQTKVPMWTGTVMTAIFLPMSLGLMRLLGYVGLPLATTIAVSGHAAMMLYLLRQKAGGIGAKQILLSAGKILVASSVMGLAMWSVLGFLQHSSLSHLPFKVAAGIRLMIPLSAGMLLFIAAIHVLQVEESATVWKMIKHRVSGSGGASASK